MQAGDYSTTGVPEPLQRRIYVNGVHRHHVSDKWDAEIGSDLPEQVSAVTGIKARTGTVVFAPVETVVDTVPAPPRRVAGWPPQRGDVLTITDATATQHWTRATARIVEVRADLGDGVVQVEWSDDLDSALSQTTELAPQANRMPGTEVSESGVLKRYWHRTGLEPWAYVVEALEDAGMRLLPSIPDVDFYALFQGTAFPRIGRIDQTYSEGDLLAWDAESGFQYLNQWSYFTPGYEGREGGDVFTVYLRKTRGGPDAQTRWDMSDGSGIRVTLQNNSVAVSHNGTVIIQQGFATDSPLPWVGASIGYNSIKIWFDGGTRTETYDAPIAEAGFQWERVRVHGAAALAVSYAPRAGWPGFNWPSLGYRAWGESLIRNTACARSVEPTTVRDLLDEIASASLTGYWLDEHGTLIWAPSARLEEQSPSGTITTRMDVLAGAWTETGGGAASEVVTSYDSVALTTASTVKVTVSDSNSGATLDHGDTAEDFVGPGSDEEWIEPDMSPLDASANADLIYEQARFSVWGGSYLYAEGKTTDGRRDTDADVYGWAQERGWLGITIDPLTPRRWKVTHHVGTASNGSTTPAQIKLTTLPGMGTQVPVIWRDAALPIWRARGRASFTSASVSHRRGPAWAPAYQHDIGAWGSRADAQRVGEYLANRMSSIQVVLSRLSVVPDPRRQLGDVVEVAAQGVLGAVMRALIVGIHESSDDGGFLTQALDLRIIRTTPSDPSTYADFEASASTYAGPESRGTYSAIEEA